jgi:hypothetical protein
MYDLVMFLGDCFLDLKPFHHLLYIGAPNGKSVMPTPDVHRRDYSQGHRLQDVF